MSDIVPSSRLTFFAKFVLPTIWIVGFGAGTATIWTIDGGPPERKFAFLAAFLAGVIMFWMFCIPLKRVRVQDGNLYISDFRNEISVPLSSVAEVTENRWVNIHPITIHLRTETPFGNKIVFMPKRRLASGWASHPVVNELRQMAAAAALSARSGSGWNTGRS
jgi:hypothetical protein